MTVGRLRQRAAAWIGTAGLCFGFSAFAQSAAFAGTVLVVPRMTAAAPSVISEQLPVDVSGWIARLRLAAQQQSYSGTLVVTTDAGHVTGSRVWHACHDDHQIERVDVLDGPARTVFRRDGEMRTFLHASRKVMQGEVIAGSVFPKLPEGQAERLDAHYSATVKGIERVAGHEADVVWLVPRDALRFGYRIWSERHSGLVLRVQTIRQDGRILEQASFLQLDLVTPVPFDQLSSAMDELGGYELLPATSEQSQAPMPDWRLRSPVPGFVLQGCRTSNTRANVVQCNYADGLTSVSVFLESFGSGTAPRAAARWSAGATTAIARPLDASTWLTVVGEVPAATLELFVERLDRVQR